MPNAPLNRRDATRRIVYGASGLATLPVLLPFENAYAQRASKPKEPRIKSLLKKGREHDWTLTCDVNISADEKIDNDGFPDGQRLAFEIAAIIFPITKETASSVTDMGAVTGQLSFNQNKVDSTFTLLENLPSDARYGRWEATRKVGRHLRLEVTTPMTCWETEFDERNATKLPWPSTLPPVAATTFGGSPYVDYQAPIFQQLINTWTDGKSPQSIAPVTLAKYFAGKVQELIQPNGDGMTTARNGLFEGLDVLKASVSASEQRGTEHDMTAVLAAIYLAAGLPARTVIGLDVSGRKDENFLNRTGKRPELKSWVEFCLFDEKDQAELWVPVDVVEMRRRSSKMGKLGSSWKYFGTNDKLDSRMPIAFHYHPPLAGAMAHGSPALYGWFTAPRMQIAEQYLRFVSRTTPKTSNKRPRSR